jgi:hypothetical protein
LLVLILSVSCRASTTHHIIWLLWRVCIKCIISIRPGKACFLLNACLIGLPGNKAADSHGSRCAWGFAFDVIFLCNSILPCFHHRRMNGLMCRSTILIGLTDNLLHVEPTPVCTSCGEPLTLSHLLIKCLLYDEECHTIHLHGIFFDILGGEHCSISDIMPFLNGIVLSKSV